MVLLHELGHLVRGDLWLQWVSLIVRAVYWFNPAVWFLHRSLLAHREEACDALVLATGAGPLEYARHLLEIASSHRSASTLSPALAMSGKCSQPGQLELRIVQLLGSRSQRPGRLAQWLGGIAATGFAALVLGTALVAPVFTSGQEVSNAVWTEEEVDLRWGAQAFPGE
jgi:bla regulator protein BlaR1